MELLAKEMDDEHEIELVNWLEFLVDDAFRWLLNAWLWLTLLAPFACLRLMMGLLSKGPFSMAEKLGTGSLTKFTRIGELQRDKWPGDCNDDESELEVADEDVAEEAVSSESSSFPSDDRQAFKAFCISNNSLFISFLNSKWTWIDVFKSIKMYPYLKDLPFHFDILWADLRASWKPSSAWMTGSTPQNSW